MSRRHILTAIDDCRGQAARRGRRCRPMPTGCSGGVHRRGEPPARSLDTERSGRPARARCGRSSTARCSPSRRGVAPDCVQSAARGRRVALARQCARSGGSGEQPQETAWPVGGWSTVRIGRVAVLGEKAVDPGSHGAPVAEDVSDEGPVDAVVDAAGVLLTSVAPTPLSDAPQAGSGRSVEDDYRVGAGEPDRRVEALLPSMIHRSAATMSRCRAANPSSEVGFQAPS